jgi:ABC-type polysaccharide/polyol phosphate export permease
MKSKLTKVLRLLIAVAFFASVAVLGLYPATKQDITIKIDANGKTVSYTMKAGDIQTMESFDVDFPDIQSRTIREIRVYRMFKSICVDKIQSSTLDNYVTIGVDKVTFNNKACDVIRRDSGSLLMERLYGVEIVLAICLLLLILVQALDEKLNPDNRGNHGPIYEIKKFINDLIKYREYVFFAAKADLKAEVANSYLNRLWWLLEPMFSMLVYVLVFGQVMGDSVQNYGTYVFSALLMFNYFSKTVNYSVKCIRNNRDIVTKVYVPKYVLLISNMILNFYKLLFSMIVLVIMMLIFRVQIGWNIFMVIPAYILMILLSFGVGMIFMHYGVYVDDLAYAVGILMQILMFLSGEFYDVITSLPVPLNTMMMCLNPVAMFIDTMRNALIYNVACNIPLIVVWIVIAVLLCYIGVHIVYKNENGYVKVV